MEAQGAEALGCVAPGAPRGANGQRVGDYAVERVACSLVEVGLAEGAEYAVA